MPGCLTALYTQPKGPKLAVEILLNAARREMGSAALRAKGRAAKPVERFAPATAVAKRCVVSHKRVTRYAAHNTWPSPTPCLARLRRCPRGFRANSPGCVVCHPWLSWDV